jgi:hypothetical protein
LRKEKMMLSDIERTPEETLRIAADGNLPRGYFVANVTGHNALYVLRGDTVIGRIDLSSAPEFSLRGSIQTTVGPLDGEVYYCSDSQDTQTLGQLSSFVEAFDRILAKSLEGKEPAPKGF